MIKYFIPKKMRSLLITSAILLTSCSSLISGYTSREVPEIRIVKREQLAELELKELNFSMPFGEKQDGTHLVETFLLQAKNQGAKYVSDLSTTLTNKKGDEYEVCTTRITPEEKVSSITESNYKPGTVNNTYVQKPVSRMTTEYEYRCAPVLRPVQRMETVYQSQYDSSSKSYRSVPSTRYVTRNEYQQECRSEPVTRYVTRYESQLEAQYIAPLWERVTKTYSEWKLVESAPVCELVTTPPLNTAQPHEMKGKIYVVSESAENTNTK